VNNIGTKKVSIVK